MATSIQPGQTWRNKSTGEMYEVHAITADKALMEHGLEFTHDALREYWELAEGGREIVLEYALVDPATKRAREMTRAELIEARSNWGIWKARYGDKQTDAGLEFLIFANRQLGRISRELRRRNKMAGT